MGQMNNDTNSLELLLRLAEFGHVATEALKQTSGGVQITDNTSLIVMCHLELRGPLRPNDIVESTHMTSGGVTKVITRLENTGLVARQHRASENDKRAVFVSLTDEGHDLIRSFGHELGDRVSDSKMLIAEMYRLIE